MIETIDWIKPEIIQDLDQLHQKDNRKAILSIMFYIILLSITGYSSYYYLNDGNYSIGLIFLFLHGSFYSFLGWSGIGHELIHRTVFKKLFLNQVFLKLFAFLTWNNYIYFEESHKRHHQYTLFNNLDQEIIMPLSITKKDWLFLLTFNFPTFYKTLKALIQNSFGKINGAWGLKLFEKDELKRKKLFNVARMILIGHSLLFLIFILYEHYELIFIITLAPFIANWLNRILGISQHIGMSTNTSDFRLNSTTIRLNWFLSRLYSNMNYHIEHHLYPNVPFYNLPVLSDQIKSFLPHPIVGILNVFKYVFKKPKENRL